MYFENLDSPLLLRIAEAFFSQYKIFGRLLLDRNISESFITRNDISDRFKYINYFLYYLEQTAGLKFDNREVPILYNTRTWNPDLDLGGFISDDCEISCDQIFSSYYAAWILQSDVTDGLPHRFLKTALWVCKNKGFNEAVAYTLAMQKYGYITDSEITKSSLYLLLEAYQNSQNDSEILSRFFDGQIPETQIEWFECFLSVKSSEDAEKIREIPESVIMLLVQAGLDECEELRNSKSYSDFFLTQSNLHSYLDLIYRLIKEFTADKSLFLKGILEQFEEIRADLNSIKLLESEYQYRWDMANAIIALAKYRGGEDFISRIVEERALIPYELVPYAIKDYELEELPTLWKELTPPISTIYLAIASQKNFNSIWRRYFFDSQDIEDEILFQVLDNYGVYEFADNSSILDFGKDFFVKMINLEVVPVLENGYLSLPVKSIPEETEFKEKLNKWKKDYLPKINTITDEIYSSLCLEDFLGEMDDAWRSTSNEELSEKIHSLYQLYPCYAQSLVELAIFYDDKMGEPLKSLDYIEKALVIAPDNSLFWQSLGVVLQNLDDKISSHYVFRYKDFLEELTSESNIKNKNS